MSPKTEQSRSESPSDLEKLGERMRIARGGTPRDSFAPTVGVSKQALGLYERGEREPGALVVREIAAKTGVDLVWLVTGAGEAWPQTPGQVPYDKEKMGLATDIAIALSEAGKLPAGQSVSGYATDIYEYFTSRPGLVGG